MNKVTKKNIQELLITLQEANSEIVRLFDVQNMDSMQGFLADCQNAAVQIGTAIEESEGEGTDAVQFLEKYCECLYQILVDKKLDAEVLAEVLAQVGKEIDAFPVKKEVVFLPYKASMWDSLESLYLAAQKDPECVVYCVPIPYYDKKNGQVVGAHYEGEEYPDYVEVTDYNTYKFEERRPDQIYIHNPYDDWNYVTTVHPRFYAKNLQNYTDELVYVPYFVLKDIEPDDREAIDEIKHFIWTPGVIYADKVILQSEKMKQIYVNELVKEAEKNGCTGTMFERSYLEKKILGTGSPKFDKVNKTQKKDIDIPPNWLKVIQKNDGSMRKVVFYNISIVALLKYNEKWVDKIEEVLKIFYDNRENIALLWRPHPLLESTMQSMREELLKRYKKIIDDYKMAGWGIYDDSADLNRAVALSDAYYGDWSSVVQLYEETGKPILIVNYEVE